MYKTREELEKMSDKNVLAYYQAERKRYLIGVSTNFKYVTKTPKDWKGYLVRVKRECDSRGHV